jgi:hypothetical protein
MRGQEQGRAVAGKRPQGSCTLVLVRDQQQDFPPRSEPIPVCTQCIPDAYPMHITGYQIHHVNAYPLHGCLLRLTRDVGLLLAALPVDPSLGKALLASHNE